jgi:hypothetical protein
MTHPAHQVEPPPEQDQTVAKVAAVLAAGAAADIMLGQLWRILRPLGYRRDGVGLALRLSDSGNRPLPGRGGGPSDVGRAQRRRELAFRAAYLLRAAARLTASLGDGASVAEALTAEKPNWKAHVRARASRLAAAQTVADTAELNGPLLGWYAHPDDATTPECHAANGANFRADTPPLIGYPGMPHGGTCRCQPGPPYATNRTVDQATARLLGSYLGGRRG